MDDNKQLRALVAVGRRTEVLMDTLALLGWPQGLPPIYKQDWAQCHIDLQQALGSSPDLGRREMTDEQPMTPEQWDAASTREGLIAQLRGQRGAGRMIMAELRECREENARLRDQIRSYQAQMVTLYGKLDHLEGELRRAEEVGDG